MKEKIHFINHELLDLVKKVNPDVRQLIYFMDNGNELCYIVFKRNFRKIVDITADSLSAITIDVLNVLE